MLLSFGLSSCRSLGGNLLFKSITEPSNHSPARWLERHTFYNRIKPEDELRLREITGNVAGLAPGMDNTFRVDADSTVILPLAGRVKVGGLTRQQAARRITEAYAETELAAPLIEVLIANMYVTVLGEVNKQGRYPILREDYELPDLLGDAQGLSINANAQDIKILRGDMRAPLVIPVNMGNVRFLTNPDCRLRSGDIVYIPPNTSAMRLKNAQQYSGFIQLGLVLISTLFILINK